jgi:hypothetical protein
VRNGRLENFNLLRVLLSRVSLLPQLVEQFQSDLPGKYQQILNRNDTVFTQMETQMTTEGGLIRINPVNLETVYFTFTGEGETDEQNQLSFSGDVLVHKDLADSMIKSAAVLSGLQDADGQIRIPLKKYVGPMESFRLYPDLETIGKKIVREKGKEEAQKWLGQVLEKNLPDAPRDEGPAPAERAVPENTAPDSGQKSLEQQLLENVFDKVFN